MQKFSKASVAVMSAFVSVLVVNVISADFLGDQLPSKHLPSQARELAFKRYANISSTLQKNLSQVTRTLADSSAESIQMQAVSGQAAPETSPSPTPSESTQVASKTQPSSHESSSEMQKHTIASTSQPQNNSSFSHVSSFWKSNPNKKTAATNEKMKIYSEPDQKKGKVLASVPTDQNFSVEQGDWVRVKTHEGIVGWALVKDIEQNITNAWNEEYQVVINGQSSNYTVTKISAQERKKRQDAAREQQKQRMKRLSSLWEQDFLSFEEGATSNEVKDLQDKVVALNKKIDDLQQRTSQERSNSNT